MSTKAKILFFSILLLALLGFAGARFYQFIQGDEWAEQRQAEQIALEKTTLIHIDRIVPFIGDKAFQVMLGSDREGKRMIVWVGDGEAHAEYADDGVSAEAVRDKVLAKSDADILRVIPGKLDETFVWEVFYSRKGGTEAGHYYDYYSFKDGSYIDTYALGM